MQSSLDTALVSSLGYCQSIDGLAVPPFVLGEATDNSGTNSGDLVGNFSSAVDSFPLIRPITTAVAPGVDGTVVAWERGVFQPPAERTMTGIPGLSCNNSPGSSRFSSNDFVPYRNCTREQSSRMSFSSRTMFLPAMQEILAEIAVHTFETTAGSDDGATIPNIPFLSKKGHQEFGPDDDAIAFQDRRPHVETTKKHLLALLKLVDDGYSQCLHEIHTVSSAFHAVTELDPNLHARFALSTVSSMYKSLRDRISTHILLPIPQQNDHQSNAITTPTAAATTALWSPDEIWAFQQQLSKRHRPQLWRPQRGLPEQSVSVLRAWMFQNFLHPYPKDGDKHLLALKSGLTRNQVSNWFINARVRLWKPMIEEMYAELNKRKQSSK